MEIFTELTNDEIQKALTEGGGIVKLWSTFKDLEGDEEFNSLRSRVKFGYDLFFDIRTVTKGYYEEIPHLHLAKIGRKKLVLIYEFWDELEKRSTEMKKVIRGLYDDTFDNQKEEKINGYEED